MSPPLVPVHATTVEYAKKLIDELTTSEPRPKARRSVPQVPSFLPEDLNRKMPAQELFGDTDTDAVSETDWENKQCSSSDGERSGGYEEAEDLYSEPEHHSDSAESSGSNYESGSSFEEVARKKDARKSIHMGKTQKAGSATSKNAAAARKKTHKSVQARALRNSPQTVYRKEQLKSSTSKQKTTVAKKRKAADSSSESETESEHSSAEEVMDFDVINKSGGKGEKKKTGKEKASQEEINAGRKPAKGSRHEVRRVEGTFEGDMREGVPIVDARPGKKRTRAGRKRKDSRKGRKQARNLGENIPDPTEILPPRAVQLRPTPEMLAAQRIESELPGIVEDPMLPEEILRPLIENELPDAGIILADEVNNEIKIWDAEVSCRGGYHWVMGDVNSHTFADPPCTPTFVPNGTPGPNIPGLASMHAIEVLERFLPLKFWAEFSQETNAYRERCQQNPINADPDEQEVEIGLNGQPYAKAAWKCDYDLPWVPLSLGQTLRWFGMNVGMAIRPRNNTAAHWDANKYGCLTPDDYSKYMSRNRFNLITKYMYLNHAEAHHFDGNGKLLNPYHKVQPLIDLCKQTWYDNWTIDEFNSVDEGKVQYSGTMCPVRSFDPDKPIKHGIKIICANDSKTGYCWGVEPYTGAGHQIAEQKDDAFYDSLTIGERLVLYFASKSPSYTSFITDRWYTTPRLCEYMFDKFSCFLTGTMMANKVGMPWNFLLSWDQLNSDRGYYTWCWERQRNLWAIVWKDRNVIPIISNRYGVDPELIERGGGGKYKTAKLKATNVQYGRYTFKTGKMVRPYNKYMGGTDMWDKLRMALFYSLEAVTHCHKWWQKLFWGLIDGALVNAYICWRSVDPTRRTHVKFMLAVHQALVNNTFDETGTWGAVSMREPQTAAKRKTPSPATPPHPIVMLPKVTSPGAVKHELVVLAKTKYWQNKIRRREVKANTRANTRCVYCRKQGRKDQFTKWACAGCGFVPLCNVKTKRKQTQDCFQRFHEERKINILIGQKEILRQTELLG